VLVVAPSEGAAAGSVAAIEAMGFPSISVTVESGYRMMPLGTSTEMKESVWVMIRAPRITCPLVNLICVAVAECAAKNAVAKTTVR